MGFSSNVPAGYLDIQMGYVPAIRCVKSSNKIRRERTQAENISIITAIKAKHWYRPNMKYIITDSLSLKTARKYLQCDGFIDIDNCSKCYINELNLYITNYNRSTKSSVKIHYCRLTAEEILY